jgi:hypothetical protein
MKITKRQLRRIIREAIDYPEGYERTNVDKVYEIIQPLFDVSNVGADRQGEISMEIADMYNATVDNPDEIYNHAEELLKIDAGYYDEAEEDWDHPDDDPLIDALRDTWDQVRVDVGISNPTPEEKGDEAMAMIQTYYPELTQQIAGKSNTEIDELLQRAFGGR